jgi:hypothetical protein
MRLRDEYRPAVLAAFIGAALYAITLFGTYVYDDVYIAQLDPRLRNVGRWGEYLTKGYFMGAPDRLWRPVTSFSFAVGWQIYGDRPWVPHAINVLLYAGICAAVAELARRVAGVRVAYVAGVLFAVHPVHIEPVAYLVGRADLLSTLLILTGIILFFRRPLTTGRAVAICACTVTAILSKETGMLLPALLLAWMPWRRAHAAGMAGGGLPPPSPDPAEKRANQLLVLLLCWTLAGYIVFREQSRVFKFSWDPVFLDWTINPLTVASRVDRWLIPFSLVGRYVQLLVFPWRLSVDYSGWTGPAFSWADPYFYVGVAAVAAWWAGFVVAIRRRAYAVVGAMLGLVLTYAMVSNFGILIGTNFGERLIFLPSVFFVLLVAMAAARLPGRVLTPALVCVAVLATVRVETYAWRWLDALRLYTMSAEEQPESARLPMLMMDRLRDKGDYEAAARAGAAGRAAQPDYWRIWYYSALVEAERGRLDEALALCERGMSLRLTDPGSFGILMGKIRSGEFGPYPPTTRPATAPGVR